MLVARVLVLVDRRDTATDVDERRGGLRGGRRGDRLEDLERVQGGRRLALRRPEICLQAPAIAAVGVAIAVEGDQRTGRVRLPVEQIEAAVEDAYVGGHEVPGGEKVDTPADLEALCNSHRIRLAPRRHRRRRALNGAYDG